MSVELHHSVKAPSKDMQNPMLSLGVCAGALPSESHCAKTGNWETFWLSPAHSHTRRTAQKSYQT